MTDLLDEDGPCPKQIVNAKFKNQYEELGNSQSELAGTISTIYSASTPRV